MTDLERVRPGPRQTLSEQECDAIIDAHLKEDAARADSRKVLVARVNHLEAELTELREAVRAAVHYKGGIVADNPWDRLRQLIEDKVKT